METNSRPLIDKCSCEESDHLRTALALIHVITQTDTETEHDMSAVDDLAQIANLASQGIELAPLVGDPAIGHPIPKS